MSAKASKTPKTMSRGNSIATLSSHSIITRPSSTSTKRGGGELSVTPHKDVVLQQEEAIVDAYFKQLESLALPFCMLKEGLSEIGDSPDKLRPVYRKLSLPRRKIENISFLSKFPNLFNLDLQGNQICDVTPISSLTYLVQLNLSYNNLSNYMYFKGPMNLQDINLAYNKIASLKGLNAPRFLTRLCIDYNQIDDLSPIASCKYLRELHMDGNSVGSLYPLKDLPLKIIRAKNNDLLDLEGVHCMQYLEELYVDNNNIESLLPLENHGQLATLSVTENSISELEDLSILASIPFLRHLWIDNNPLIENSSDTWDPELTFPLHENAYFKPSFSLYTTYLLSNLTILEGFPVGPEEKVAAANMYHPVMEVSSSIQHANHLKVQSKNYVRIKAEDLLRSKRLCPIVICGPSGAGKRTLTRRLLQEFPHIYGLCVSHTTRKPRPGEEHGVHYYFVTKQEMERMNAEGKFIEYVSLFGNNYGTSMDSIDNVTEQGKVCILDLEFEGVVALKKSMLKPKYILIKTANLDVLQERLAQSHRIDLNDPSLAQWVEKARKGHYQDSDYDTVIVNDDLEKAYKQVKDYCLSVYWKAFEEDE